MPMERSHALQTSAPVRFQEDFMFYMLILLGFI